MPKTALNNKSIMGFRLFFCTLLNINKKETRTTNKVNATLSKITVCENKAFPWNKTTLIRKTIAVDKIRAIMTGLTPFKAPCTYLLFKNLERIIATRMMIINDGRITPMVEQTAPKAPPTCEPTNVEILIANGPGVVSLMAIKSDSCESVSHPFPTI